MTLSRPTGFPVRSRQGRRILVATVLGAGIAGIDTSVVNVALPDIGRDLGASFSSLQWTVTGYTLSLASLILLAGGLGDRYGRRRIFLTGVAVFTLASVLCAAVPDVLTLVGARILQGVGGALMAPASMAILQATIAPGDRPVAIGTWSGFAGIAGALAPFAGGWLLSLGSWRWIFLINVPVAAVVLVISLRHLPETRDESSPGMDWGGSALAFASLAAATYALTVLPADPTRPPGLASAVVAVGAGAGFAWYERRTSSPMLPTAVAKSRAFITINVLTFVVYGAFAVFSIVFTIALETVAGYSPAEAGSTMVPIRPETGYWSVAIPLECVFGVGTAAMVVPLTSVALSSLPGGHVGVASAVNNTVARTAGLVWVAGLPPLVGLAGDSSTQGWLFLPGYRLACVICAAAMFVSGAIAAVVGRRPQSGLFSPLLLGRW